MAAVVVAGLAGLATVQDAGRPGHMHEGVPPGGALVPELLARANAAADNAPGEAAVELLGAMALVARGALVVASDGGERRELEDGQRWSIACAGARVRYVAVRGGIDVPVVLGGRGTLLVAKLGGHEGRALRRGDALRAGASPAKVGPLPAPPDLAAPVRVVPGPDLDRLPRACLEALLASTFTVDPRSDRVGVRLSGPALPGARADTGPSAPMVRGAIQLPPSGAPIVLGPDHPTTGGYPVLATVVRADLGSLAARPAGAQVRFVAGT